MAFEISEHCYACQKRHLKEVRKSGWEVKCNYITKGLWDNGYYPIEEIIPDEDYKKLNKEKLLERKREYREKNREKIRIGLS